MGKVLDALTIRRRKVSLIRKPFPSTWNELSVNQLWWVNRLFLNKWELLFEVTEKGVSIRDKQAWWEMQLQLYYRLSGMELKAFDKLVAEWMENCSYDEIMGELRDALAFLFKENGITVNPFHKLRGGFFSKHIFYKKACVKGLLHCTADEFVFADSYFIAYKKSDGKNVAFLNKFIAALYHRKGFENKTVLDREKWAASIPRWKKDILVRWWEGCRAELQAKFPYTFNGNNSGGSGTWVDVLLGMAGGKFGNFKETGEVNVMVLFKQCENELAQADAK